MALNTVQRSQQINIYEPLPDGAYTRVLILEPGRRWQPLRCQFKIVNLEQDPDFEAISYVWGRGIKRKEVVCNGARVKVTANLLQALVAVRYPSRPRTVWADSISINQNDNEEKGRQVALMGLIYNRARRVLIHLAVRGDDQGHAHMAAAFVSEKVAMIHQTPGDTLAKVLYLSAEEVQLLMEDPRLVSVWLLLDHAWFERGWVIQEAGLARDAVIIWGSRITARFDSLMICHSWLVRMLRDAYNKNNFRALSVLPELYHYRFRDVARHLGNHVETQLNLLRILDSGRRAKLRDPRDRIYAFLYLDGLDDGLDITVDATTRFAIQPDYSKSVCEVYTDFARHCVKSGDIKLLHYVQHTQESLVQEGFASWVPRWDVREHFTLGIHTVPSLHPSHPISDIRSKDTARFDENCLIVQGVVFDRVRACHCYSIFKSYTITLDDVASFWREVRSSTIGSAYPPEHLGLALLYTLTQGHFNGKWIEWFKKSQVFCQFLRAIEQDSDTARGFGSRIPDVEEAISMGTAGRKLVSTERGYFALAPQITKENDMCSVVFGCCHPFILREEGCPSGSDQQRYRVVGDAYMTGKHPSQDRKGRVFMNKFGRHTMEWETEGLKQGDIRLV